MSIRQKISLVVPGLGLLLLLGACGAAGPETRPVFGYSGLVGSDSGLSTYEQAKADFTAARYGLAVNRFQLAMAEEPQSIEAVNGLAAAYDQLGRFDLAERYYRRALAMDPNSAQTLNNLGYSMLLQGKPQMALALFRDAARLEPESDVLAANAELAVAARMRLAAATDPVTDAPGAAEASPVSLPAGPAPRILRFSAGEQRLQLQPQPRAAIVEIHTVPPMPAMPLPEVEVVPLPVADSRPAPTPEAPVPASQPAAALPTVRVALQLPAEAALLPAGPPEAGVATVDLSGSLELANGNGRRHMAARTKTYLIGLGFAAARLTNADRFTHRTTTITYRPGYLGLAEAVSASLPVAPLLKEVAGQATDVRIELGGDLLEFDRGHLQAERNTSHADAV
jgi:tetratricopeptide (TPR) repeat protein